MRENPQFPADLVTFTEEILNGKPHVLCSEDASGWLSVMSSRALNIPEIARKKSLKISHAQAIFCAQVLITMFFFSWYLCSTMYSESLNKMKKSEEKNRFYYNTL